MNSSMDREMMKALRKDQEYLEAITGEDQPLYFLDAEGKLILDCDRAVEDACAMFEARP